MDGEGRRRRHGRRQLARHVPRRAAERRRRRGDRLQRRPSRRRGTRRAGDALRQAGGCEALSVGRLLRARRRQDVGRRLGYSGRRDHPELGARPLGPRQVRPRRGCGRRRRRRWPISNTRGSRSPRSSRAAGSWPPRQASRRSWRGRPSDAARSWFGSPKRGRAWASATTRTSRWRKPTSALIATRSDSSSWRASRRSGRWRSSSGAIRPPRRSVSARLPGQPDADSGGTSVGAPRAPPRCRGGRAAHRRRLQPRRRGQGSATADDRPDDRCQQHLERALRAPGPRQPGVEPRRQPARADLQRRRAQDAGRDQDRRTEAGRCRLRLHRPARVRRSRKRAVGGARRARPRANPHRARSPTASAPSKSCRRSSRSAAPIFASSTSGSSPSIRRARRSSASRPSSGCSASTSISRSAAASNRGHSRRPTTRARNNRQSSKKQKGDQKARRDQVRGSLSAAGYC